MIEGTDRDLLAAVVDMADVLILTLDREGRVHVLNRCCGRPASAAGRSPGAGPSRSSSRSGIEIDRQCADEVDVVLLDLSMPTMSGEAVLAEPRHLRPEARVVLSSGYSEEDTRSRVVGAGDVGYLPKPYGPAQLVETLRAALAA